MPQLDRRDFLSTLSLAGLTRATSPTSPTAGTNAGQDTAMDVRDDVSRRVAKYVVAGKYEDVPAAVRKEARRTLLNWVGCTVCGSHLEADDYHISHLAAFVGS